MRLFFILAILYVQLKNGVRCVPLSDFYSFGGANGTSGESFLPPNDDGSSPPIMLTSVFPFFDENFDIIYVNTNGAISFTHPISQYTPDSFPTNATEEIIAPYWADVDTTGTGNIGYRETRDPDLLQKAEYDIRRAFPTIRFSSEYIFIATWDHVGYYSSRVEKTNTFQAVLATDGLLSFVIFLYGDGEIQWTTGEASGGTDGLGGTPAQVGFDAGDGIRYFAVPGSQTADIINIAETSNVGIPGMWIFRIDGQEIVTAGCQIVIPTDNVLVPITLFPRYGNVLGGTVVQVFGPCFDHFIDYSITCFFDEAEVQAIVVDADSIICISPALRSLGRVDFTLYIDGIEPEFQTSTFYSLAVEEASTVNSISNNEFDLFYVTNDTVEIAWDTTSFIPQSILEEFDVTVTVNIELFELDTETGNTRFVTNLASGISNIGQHTITIPSMVGEMSTAVFQVTVDEVLSSSSNQSIPEYIELVFNEIRGQTAQWSDLSYVSESNYVRSKCEEWCESQPEDIGEKILERLPPCPPTANRAEADSVFEEEKLPLIGDLFRELFHPGTSSCYRQVVFTDENEGSGQQCCYDQSGELLVGPPGGGTVDLYAPTDLLGKYRHFRNDVLPFFYCCKGEFPNCEAYYQKRPSDDGSRYVLQPPACVYGDPHMVTLDGYKYTFNGKGEFTLVKHVNETFTLQARMVEVENSDGQPASATVFSAIAAKQRDSSTVELRQSRRGLDALVNGVMVNFEDLPTQEFDNVTLSDLGNQTVSAIFSSGAYVQAKVENGIISVLLVSLPDSFQNATYGLMGVFNKDMTDDLMMKNSTQYLPLNSTNEDIHWQFGLSWIVNEEESLFTYQLRESWSDFYDPSFTPLFSPVFTDPSLEAEARAACDNDTFCLYDIATTGRMDIGLSTLDGSKNFEEIVQLSYPIVCNPPCVQGACVANDTCNCAEGYTGERCTEPVYTECEVNRCENGGTCVKLAASYMCNCADDYAGTLCETFTGFSPSPTPTPASSPPASGAPAPHEEDSVDKAAAVFITLLVLGVVAIVILLAAIIATTVYCYCIKSKSTVVDQHPEQALASAPVNPAYAMNEAYTSDNKEMDDAIKVVDNQDAKLTENVY